MTTPPKARRYHASISESVTPGTASRTHDPEPAPAPAPQPKAAPKVHLEVSRKPAPPAEQQEGARLQKFLATEPIEDGFGDLRMTGPEKGPGASGAAGKAAGQPAAAGVTEEQLAAIRAEKLTERQLRIAGRIATLHQIEFASNEEAILRLRERGIDPSQRSAVGRILSSEGTRAKVGDAPRDPAATIPALRTGGPAGLPALTPGDKRGKTPALPSREDLTEDRRAAEIYRIQKDLARRRRKRMMMLAFRLLIFVLIPTFAVGWYYARVASPLYATFTQFQIQTADGGSSGGMSSLLGGSGMGTNTDSVAVQSYLTSRDAMLRLDADKGFKRAYQDPSIDPIKRLEADATNEAAFDVYEDSVKIGYDPTEGVLNMEVIAPDPQLSVEFSQALISYAEQQVDAMTSRMRADQMDGAIQTYQDAEAKMLAAQQRVQELQQTLGVLDPVAESTVVMGKVTELESQLTAKQLELGQLLANARPVQSRVDAVRGDIERLRSLVAETRLQLTQGSDSRNSLAAIGGQLRVAEAEMATRQEMLAASAAQMEAARIEANKQVRYLSLSVSPIAPDEATYPKAFQNTIVAFLIFSGIYLMMSLTASILREQVST
ncbi:MAG: capsule biosynthesis protein [Paracoccus sp. (in: a-proteobacteria)]|uniref:capsule biosynthesis protein n=1 Tax=Paracoccus sp. TaxID=267 RepID=UPI003242ADD4